LNIGGGSFPKFDDWIVDAINDAQQECQDIEIKEIDISKTSTYMGLSCQWNVGLW